MRGLNIHHLKLRIFSHATATLSLSLSRQATLRNKEWWSLLPALITIVDARTIDMNCRADDRRILNQSWYQCQWTVIDAWWSLLEWGHVDSRNILIPGKTRQKTDEERSSLYLPGISSPPPSITILCLSLQLLLIASFKSFCRMPREYWGSFSLIPPLKNAYIDLSLGLSPRRGEWRKVTGSRITGITRSYKHFPSGYKLWTWSTVYSLDELRILQGWFFFFD